MMKQMTFADAEYASKRKQTRKELFLIEMDQVVPWKGLIALLRVCAASGYLCLRVFRDSLSS
ncbi:hypothetical protein SAMN05444502_102346 [Pseudomonas sp. BS3759]|nr:hypothetical protein SAMN05444502_102346 [Pseudomonas sp. BS3759]